MSYIVSAVEAIAAHLHHGMLVILESTTYPGTTEELVKPMLEAGGLTAGVDFFLAFSPERVDPGNPTFNTHNVPKVVGGIGRGLDGDWPARCMRRRSSASSRSARREVAEMVKLLENTFRAVNIGLVNEIALMCDRLGIDVWEVVAGRGNQAIRLHALLPGTGPRRPLHSDRPVLPVVESEAERLRSALHRARRPNQRLDAALRRRQDRRRAEPRPQGAQRLDHPDSRARLQARYRRHPRIAVARRDDGSARARRAGPVYGSARARIVRPRVARRRGTDQPAAHRRRPSPPRTAWRS